MQAVKECFGVGPRYEPVHTLDSTHADQLEQEDTGAVTCRLSWMHGLTLTMHGMAFLIMRHHK